MAVWARCLTGVIVSKSNLGAFLRGGERYRQSRCLPKVLEFSVQGALADAELVG